MEPSTPEGAERRGTGSRVPARWQESVGEAIIVGMTPIRRIGVIGAGTMGNGIAQVFAQSGYEVRLVDAVQPALDRARTTIEKSLGRFVEKGRMTPEERDGS